MVKSIVGNEMGIISSYCNNSIYHILIYKCCLYSKSSHSKKVTNLNCTTCGAEIKRAKPLKIMSCFDCRAKRQKKYNKEHYKEQSKSRKKYYLKNKEKYRARRK